MRSLALLAAAAALAGAAGVLPSPALLAPAVGLVLVTATAWASVIIVTRRVTITRSVPSREAVEDTPVWLRFDIDGLGHSPVTLEARVDDTWVPLGELGAEVSHTIVGRGPHRLRPSLIRVRDALGIAERRLYVGPPELVLGLPRPDIGALAAERSPSTASTDDVDLDGLVPYTPGTPIGRIHWPALARGAGLQTRRIAPAAGGLPLVVVETAGDPGAAAVDWAARVSAGVILRFARAGGCRVLLPGDREPTTVVGASRQWHAVHRRLALMQPVPGASRAPLPGLQAGAVRVDAASAPATAAEGRRSTT
jgi:uncharacterized protein (DUF58 family)